jgi:hypothetical protein
MGAQSCRPLRAIGIGDLLCGSADMARDISVVDGVGCLPGEDLH